MNTLPQLLALSKTDEGKQKIRVMVAQLAGHVNINVSCWRSHKGGVETAIPDFTGSLDAIMPEVRKLDEQARNRWINLMDDIIDPFGELGWKADFERATSEPVNHCIALLLSTQTTK